MVRTLERVVRLLGRHNIGNVWIAGNSMMAACDTLMTAKAVPFPWPEEVAAAALEDHRHVAIREHLLGQAKFCVDFCMEEKNAQGVRFWANLSASLMEGQGMVQDVCLVAVSMFKMAINIIQYVPRDGALHVTRYAGKGVQQCLVVYMRLMYCLVCMHAVL